MTTNLSLEMLRAGWATTYEQSNAEYGASSKDEFLRTEEEAKCVQCYEHRVHELTNVISKTKQTGDVEARSKLGKSGRVQEAVRLGRGWWHEHDKGRCQDTKKRR